MRRFVKIRPSRNGEITLSFIYIGKSCPSREFQPSKICLLTLFTKKILAKIPNLQKQQLGGQLMGASRKYLRLH